MEDSFYFGLLRVSVAQILKGCGFDKCLPSVVNTLTALYIQYHQLVIQNVVTNHELKQASEYSIDDITRSLLDTGLIKYDFGESILAKRSPVNIGDNNKYVTKSVEAFRQWLDYSDTFEVSKRLTLVPDEMLRNLTDKRRIDGDDGDEKRRKKRRERQATGSFALFRQGENGGDDGEGEGDEELELEPEDRMPWLNYMMEKDIKLGQDYKYIDTVLFPQFEKYLSNPKFHPLTARNLDKYYAHVKKINEDDYIAADIEDEEDENTVATSTTAPGAVSGAASSALVSAAGVSAANANPVKVGAATASGSRVELSEELIRNLPYNIRYSKILVDDDLLKYVAKLETQPDEADAKDHSDAEEPYEDNVVVMDQVDVTHLNDEGIGGDNNLLFM